MSSSRPSATLWPFPPFPPWRIHHLDQASRLCPGPTGLLSSPSQSFASEPGYTMPPVAMFRQPASSTTITLVRQSSAHLHHIPVLITPSVRAEYHRSRTSENVAGSTLGG